MRDYSHRPVEKKTPSVAVRDTLLEILKDQPAFMSAGGQTVLHIDAAAGNGFAVPLHSDYLRGWVSVRHTSDGHPPPTDAQLRHAIRAKESLSLGGTTRNVRVPLHLRYAWNPQHRIPVPDTQGLDGNDFDVPFELAYVLSLNTAYGHHVAVTADRWVIHPGNTEFIYNPLEERIPDPVIPTAEPAEVLQPFRKLLRLDGSHHDDTWQTILNWTLNAMRAPKDPTFHTFPILNLMGPADSAKSVTARILTKLLDPTLTPVHSLPTTERRLHGLAATHYILTFDGPGKINPEKSRQLSRLASGVTSLHRDLQGMLVRPIILATTDEKETRHLEDKVVDVDLPAIEDPMPLEEIRQQFEAMRPQVMGALLTLLVGTLETPPPIRPNRKTKNQKIEASVTKVLTANGGSWQGTATDLLAHVPQTLVCTPEAMGRALEQMTSIHLTRLPRKNRERPIHLELRPSNTHLRSYASCPTLR